MSTREAVARAIFSAANPSRSWAVVPVAELEYWGGLADVAIAAYKAAEQ